MKIKKEFAEVCVRVEKACLSCVKSDVREDEETLFCTLSGHEVADRMSCDAWECNLGMFSVCGFDVVESSCLHSHGDRGNERNEIKALIKEASEGFLEIKEALHNEKQLLRAKIRCSQNR